MTAGPAPAARIADPDRLEEHLWTELLPLWAEHGYDRVRGGFHNRLDAQLRPAADDYKRVVVQARQVYSFAWAARETGDARFLERAEQGLNFMREHFFDAEHGGWFLTTSLAGEPLDRSKDCYAHAFVLLALAHFARATGRPEPLQIARETVELLDQRLGDPRHGGFLEGATESWAPLPGPQRRRHNPHMHLFEAFLALHAASGEAAYLGRAEALARLLEARWIDPELGCLYEYFGADWTPATRVDDGAVEPGHHFEWVWLLHQHARLRADAGTARAAAALWSFGLRHGIDPTDGTAFDAVDPGGAPRRETKRLWPQTEYLKALGSQLEWHACGDSARRLRRGLELCFARYVDPRTRGWREHATRAGEIFSPYMNATSVYHVVTALLETARVLRQHGERDG